MLKKESQKNTKNAIQNAGSGSDAAGAGAGAGGIEESQEIKNSAEMLMMKTEKRRSKNQKRHRNASSQTVFLLCGFRCTGCKNWGICGAIKDDPGTRRKHLRLKNCNQVGQASRKNRWDVKHPQRSGGRSTNSCGDPSSTLSAVG